MSVKISVIIPTFNRAYCLERAISSVLNQSYLNIEIIIVDDGSTDETGDLISKYPEIEYFRTANFGVSAARNLGVAKSSGEWLAFLDSDDEWLPNKLEKQIEFIKKNEQIRIVHGEEIWIRRGKRVNQKKIHQKFGGFIFKKCLGLCLISPSAVLIERKLFNEVDGFDEEYIVCEDYDLWLKITSLYEVGFISDPIIKKYGGHDDQLSAKYFAMDYWRVRSLDNLMGIRDLKSSDLNSVVLEIVKKADILLKGYKKHNNLEHFEEIEAIFNKYNNFL